MNVCLQDSLALLRKMVRIPSTTFNEKAVSDLLVSAMESWGMQPRRYGLNIVTVNRTYDAGRPTLVLDAHIDTVQPSDGYSRDPFDPGENEDVIYGLGSNDDGASVVSMIAAFRMLKDRELPVNLVLCLSCQEEKNGDDGARFMYGHDGPEEVRNASWVIFGEPTGMRVATSERGLLVLDGTAVGVSGHAARKEGVNALYLAMDDISALRSHVFSRISPIMGEVGLNVTMISAGTAHNVIPDKCSFVVDIRPTEQYSNEEILQELQSVCGSSLRARNLRNSSSATKADSPLLRTALRLGKETFSSPTTSNWMVSGKDGIKMGPGDSSRSHHADEYVLVSEIVQAVDGYVEFIEDFYGNTLE